MAEMNRVLAIKAVYYRLALVDLAKVLRPDRCSACAQARGIVNSVSPD